MLTEALAASTTYSGMWICLDWWESIRVEWLAGIPAVSSSPSDPSRGRGALEGAFNVHCVTLVSHPLILQLHHIQHLTHRG